MLKDMDKRNKDIETLLGRKLRMDPLKAPSSHAGSISVFVEMQKVFSEP